MKNNNLNSLLKALGTNDDYYEILNCKLIKNISDNIYEYECENLKNIFYLFGRKYEQTLSYDCTIHINYEKAIVLIRNNDTLRIGLKLDNELKQEKALALL